MWQFVGASLLAEAGFSVRLCYLALSNTVGSGCSGIPLSQHLLEFCHLLEVLQHREALNRQEHGTSTPNILQCLRGEVKESWSHIPTIPVLICFRYARDSEVHWLKPVCFSFLLQPLEIFFYVGLLFGT